MSTQHNYRIRQLCDANDALLVNVVRRLLSDWISLDLLLLFFCKQSTSLKGLHSLRLLELFRRLDGRGDDLFIVLLLATHNVVVGRGTLFFEECCIVISVKLSTRFPACRLSLAALDHNLIV